MPPIPIEDAIHVILGLRRAERDSKSRRDEIATAREFLETQIGRTVRPATAARMLSISRPALKKWIDKGEIPTVMTPRGTREVPLEELLELLEEIGDYHGERVGRPVARVIRDRLHRSAETIDIDRLLPSTRPRGHRTAELHALAYHRVVAERLTQEILEAALRRLRRWESSGRIDPRWAAEWRRVLGMPLPKVAKAIGSDSPRARELRQTSPFAGVLSEPERRRLVQLVEDRARR